MTETTKERCINCKHLTKRNFCKRYNLSFVGTNLALCVCECFTPASDENANVSENRNEKNPTRV